MRDQAVVRFTCTLGFMACVRMAPKGGKRPDGSASEQMQHLDKADARSTSSVTGTGSTSRVESCRSLHLQRAHAEIEQADLDHENL